MLSSSFSKAFFAAVVMGGVVIPGGAAFAAQSTANASANAGVRIITPISLTKTTDLNFGDVVPGATVGTVSLTTAGARTSTGGTSLGNSTSVAAAGFNVGGQASSTYAITLPTTASITSGANTMTVDGFISNPAATGTLSAGGAQALAVGGNLNVGASQATGTYTGTFAVTVNYN